LTPSHLLEDPSPHVLFGLKSTPSLISVDVSDKTNPFLYYKFSSSNCSTAPPLQYNRPHCLGIRICPLTCRTENAVASNLLLRKPSATRASCMRFFPRERRLDYRTSTELHIASQSISKFAINLHPDKWSLPARSLQKQRVCSDPSKISPPTSQCS
jgi:hypothetical protein